MKTQAIVSACFAVLLTVSPVLGSAPVGQIISIQGTAVVQSDDGNKEKLALKSSVRLNDRIQTQEDTKLQIMLLDDSIVSMGEKSELVIDEYVYNPDVKEDNKTSVSLIKGVFRVITAKITDLNPEQFKVKSNMATIGIRGCELGFDIQDDFEEIQIVRIPEKKEIVVGSLLTEDLLTVFQQGVQITQSKGSGLMRRPLTASDVKRIFDATTASIESAGTTDGPSVGPEGVAASWPERQEMTEVSRGLDLADSDVAIEEDKVEAATSLSEGKTQADNVASDVTTVEPATQRVDVDAIAELNKEAAPAPVAAPVARTPVRADPAPANVGAGDQSDESEKVVADTRPPVNPVVPGVTIVRTPQGGGTDWQWGTWEQEDVTVDPNGAARTTITRGAEVSGSELSPTEFQAIAQAGSPRLLTGTGIAAAGVTQGSQSALLTGTSDMQVTIGGNVTPTWDGDFSMNGSAGEKLSFAANGVIDPASAEVRTAATGYQLDAFGSSHSEASLSRNEVQGKLVGNGGNVTGTTGSFDFEHGVTGPKVKGVFGSDLN